MGFGEFCKISSFIEKDKNQRKEKKGLHELGPAHNETSPTARIQAQSEKETHQERPTQI